MRRSTFILVIMSVTAITISAILGSAAMRGAQTAPPTILLTPDRVSQMRSMHASDAEYRNLITFLDKQFNARNFNADMQASSPLSQARRVQWEVLIGSVLWKVRDDESAADKALAAIRAGTRLSAFKDDDYAATAELMAGLAVGYDLYYDRLAVNERKDILSKFSNQGFRWAKKQKSDRKYWTTINENAPTVAYSSLLLASVVAPQNDADTKTQKNLYRDQAPLLRTAYGNTGGSAEGVMYWNYVAYSVLMAELAAKDAGQPVSSQDSILAKLSPSFPTYIYGPTGDVYNYGDAFEETIPAPISFMSSNVGDHFWYRRHIGDFLRKNGRGWYWQEYRYLGLAAILWTNKGSASDLAAMPLDRQFDSTDVVGTFRSSWTDPNGIFVGYHGGSSEGVHTQLDLGSFIYESEGVRWIVDMGQELAKDDYFDKTRGGRWNWLRASSESHSVLLTQNGGSKPNQLAASAGFSVGTSSPYGILDLSSSYGLSGYTRTFQLKDRRQLQVKDQLSSGLTGGKWQVVTTAQISLDGRCATLRQNGKSALIEVVEPTGVQVRTGSFPSGKKINKSIDPYKTVWFDVPSGTKQIIVRISPN